MRKIHQVYVSDVEAFAQAHHTAQIVERRALNFHEKLEQNKDTRCYFMHFYSTQHHPGISQETLRVEI